MAQLNVIARSVRIAALPACAGLLCACSTTVDLQNRATSVEKQATLGRPSARVFVDRVVLPRFPYNRIGAVYTPARDHLHYITTDVDIGAWLQNEWYTFLERHSCRPVEDVNQADYAVDCRVDTLRIESINPWFDPEQYHAVIEMDMKILDRRSGTIVFDREWQTHYATDRTEMGETISDHDIYAHCLSTVVQKALEQIRF